MPRLSRRVPGTLALCIAAVVGCNSAKHLAPTPTGSMTVTINAADGTAPSVVVTGPKSYSKTITATQTLTGLAIGSYTIVADSAVGPDSVVGSNIDTSTVTGSPATVANAATATVTVSYAMKRHMGGLWVANNNNGTIPELASSQLRVTGTPTPAETLATHQASGGLALDANGNMWEASFESDSLFMYTPAARNTGGARSLAIGSVAITDAEGLTVDANGNLWVANREGNLLGYTPSQLTAGGTQTPHVIISASVLLEPEVLVFDAQGNAWVADFGHPHLIEFSAAQLAASGTPTPIDTIGATGGSLATPSGLAFDASGNLWVSNIGNSTLVEYTPAQLTAGGAPVPHAIITLPSGTEPFGIAFDNRGTLWVSAEGKSLMYGLTSSQLATTGSPTPAISVTPTMSSFAPEQPLFDPDATGTVIATSRVRRTSPSMAQHRSTNANVPAHFSR